jgi:hypothetical protein
MAEFKFSCPQCGQHLSGNEQWSGHQIKCPACATALTVPQAPQTPTAAAPAPQSLIPQPPVSHGAKLSAGATQVTRPPAPGSIPIRQLAQRPSKTQSPLLKYAVYAIVLAVLAGAAYLYVPSLLSKFQDGTNSKPPQAEPAAKSSGSGPLGEVNGAMDVSDTLDGGTTASPRPAPTLQSITARKPKPAAATTTAGATNNTSGAKSRQPRPVPHP